MLPWPPMLATVFDLIGLFAENSFSGGGVGGNTCRSPRRLDDVSLGAGASSARMREVRSGLTRLLAAKEISVAGRSSTSGAVAAISCWGDVSSFSYTPH